MVRAIIWTNCDTCGTEWPFPHADNPSSGDREWVCPVCIAAREARRQRRVEQLLSIIHGRTWDLTEHNQQVAAHCLRVVATEIAEATK